MPVDDTNDALCNSRLAAYTAPGITTLPVAAEYHGDDRYDMDLDAQAVMDSADADDDSTDEDYNGGSYEDGYVPDTDSDDEEDRSRIDITGLNLDALDIAESHPRFELYKAKYQAVLDYALAAHQQHSMQPQSAPAIRGHLSLYNQGRIDLDCTYSQQVTVPGHAAQLELVVFTYHTDDVAAVGLDHIRRGDNRIDNRSILEARIVENLPCRSTSRGGQYQFSTTAMLTVTKDPSSIDFSRFEM